MDSQFHEDYMTINYKNNMKYYLAEAYYTDKLIEKVNELLSQGWTTLGSVKIVKDDQKQLLFIQALIKKEQ